jgi:hypothetical protein
VTDYQRHYRSLVSGRGRNVSFVSKSTSVLSLFNVLSCRYQGCLSGVTAVRTWTCLALCDIYFNIERAFPWSVYSDFPVTDYRNYTQPQCSLEVQIEWGFTRTPPMHLFGRYFGFNLKVPMHLRVWLASPAGLGFKWVKLVRVWSVTSRTCADYIYISEPGSRVELPEADSRARLVRVWAAFVSF